MKPSLDVFSTQHQGSAGMNLNIELQAKMIEELLVKNAQLSEESTQAQQMRGPFNANESMEGGHGNTYGMPVSNHDNGPSSYRENVRLA